MDFDRIDDPDDPLLALKQAGRDLLLTLGCATRCTVRRRTSFGWVLEVCGLCQRETANGGSGFALIERFQTALDATGWDTCPTWALRYLADGPKPVPWASMQLQGQDGAPSPAAPAWAVRLLHLGTPMKSYVKATGSISVLWPKVFDLCARDETTRNALDAVVRLSRQAGMTHAVNGRHAYTANDCHALYSFLLETPQAVGLFGGVSQENTRLVVRSPR